MARPASASISKSASESPIAASFEDGMPRACAEPLPLVGWTEVGDGSVLLEPRADVGIRAEKSRVPLDRELPGDGDDRAGDAARAKQRECLSCT
jgi:hypothetical protein